MLFKQMRVIVSLLAGSHEDSSAGLGVRCGVMVFERNIQMPAHIRQFGRTKVPQRPRDFDGAEVGLGGFLERGGSTAGIQDRPIKRGIMGCDKIHAVQKRSDLRPQLRERRFIFDIAPGNAVQVGKTKARTRRSD